MVRAIALCAMYFAVHAAAAQSVTPRIIASPGNEPEPAIGISSTVTADEREEQEVAPSTTEGADVKPINKHALLRQKLAELNCLQSEIDELRVATGTPQQIILNVKAIEVSRTRAKALGIDGAMLRGDKQLATSNTYTPPKSAGSSEVDIATAENGDPLLALYERLLQSNAAKVLAEPDLMVTCGRPAHFNVGGEVPIPGAQGSKQSVEYRPVGTQVDVVAFALGNARVRLELCARVSEIDTSKQTKIDGVTIPGFSVRQVDSGLELKLGQTGVISGVIQPRIEASIKDGQVENRTNEIELVFLVTPELAPTKIARDDDANSDAAEYRTATSASEERPNERSLRVTRPSTPR